MPRTVHRRTAAVVFSSVVAAGLLGIAVFVTVRYGGVDALVAWVVTAALAALAVVSGVLPKLVTTPSQVEVHNMFTEFDIPYPAVAEAVLGRRGLAIRTVGGRFIPVVGFGPSWLAEQVTGNAAARRAASEINRHVLPGGPDPDEPAPAIRRRLKVSVIAGLATIVVLAVLVLVLVP
jgi:hypothetical protein